MWKKRRIALRACGTAIAIPNATTRSATANTTGRRQQPRSHLTGQERRLGGRGRAPRGLLRRRPQCKLGAPARRAAAIPCLVRDDVQEPGPEGRAFPEASERTPGLDESVLCRLLRV